jgi:bacterioferritin
MKGDPDIIELLNDVLTSELTAINQYFVHSKMLSNWGYPKLAEQKREESIEEMKHADEVIDRILFLDGTPNMQRLNPVRVGEEPIEMHELDLQLEVEACKRLNEGIALCRTRVTTAPGSCWPASSPKRKRGWTGWRRSCTWSSRWAARRTWPSTSGAEPGTRGRA